MTARIDTSGLSSMLRGLRRTSSLQKDMTDDLHATGPKIVSDIKSAASSKMQNAAAGTVTLSRDSKGIEIGSGSGSASFPGVIFDGAEYGGRKSKKVVYATRSPLGKAYVVRRRTTMQFLPHLGHEGYWFWRTIRDWMPKLEKQQDAIIEKAMSRR